MQADWEIDAQNGGKEATEQARRNKPPALTVRPAATVVVSTPLLLTASVSDDGLPKPQPKRKPTAQDRPPILVPNADDPEIPVNVPSAVDPGRGQRSVGGQSLHVDWVVWRGPASAAFAKRSADVKDGVAVVTATFPQPGTYVLRASASDGALMSEVNDVTVTVTP
jgi:hypothetical protein